MSSRRCGSVKSDGALWRPFVSLVGLLLVCPAFVACTDKSAGAGYGVEVSEGVGIGRNPQDAVQRNSSSSQPIVRQPISGQAEPLSTLGSGSPSTSTLALNSGRGPGVEGRSTCVEEDLLQPVEHPYYFSLPQFPRDQVSPDPVERLVQFTTLRTLLLTYFLSAEGLLRIEVPAIEFDESDLWRAEWQRHVEESRADVSELIAELRASGFCNVGVSRELSVRAVAEGFASALAYSEYGYEATDAPHRFGSPSLLLSYHDPTDPFHLVVTGLEGLLMRTLRASDIWNLFLWKFAVGIRHCDYILGVPDDQPVRELLGQLIEGPSASQEWSELAKSAITSAGYAVAEYEDNMVMCVADVTAHRFDAPYDEAQLAGYLASANEQIIRQWLSDNSELIPDNLLVTS